MFANNEIYRCVHLSSQRWFLVRVHFKYRGVNPLIASITSQIHGKLLHEMCDFMAVTGVPPAFAIYKQFEDKKLYRRMQMKLLREDNDNQFMLIETDEMLPSSYFDTLKYGMLHVQTNSFMKYISRSRPASQQEDIAELSQKRNGSHAESALKKPNLIASEQSSVILFKKSSLPPIISNPDVFFEPIRPLPLEVPVENASGFSGFRSYMTRSGQRSQSLINSPYDPSLGSFMVDLEGDPLPQFVERSGDSEEVSKLGLLNPNESFQSLSHAAVGLSPSRGVLKTRTSEGSVTSPKRSSSNLKVHFDELKLETTSPTRSVPQYAASSERSDQPASRRRTRPGSASLILRLYNMACDSLLGKWSIMILFLGLVSLLFVTNGTALYYGASATVVAGAVAFGISLFHASCAPSVNSSTVLSTLSPSAR